MSPPICEKCLDCQSKLRSVRAALERSGEASKKQLDQVQSIAENFDLWVSNTYANHPPDSPYSLENRLRDKEDVLKKTLEALDELSGLVARLSVVVCDDKEGRMASHEGFRNEASEKKEEREELLEKLEACRKPLIAIAHQVYEILPQDRFISAQPRDLSMAQLAQKQSDIEQVAKIFPKLDRKEYDLVKYRLGSAINQRRHYLDSLLTHESCLKILDLVTSQEKVDAIRSDPSIGGAITEDLFEELRSYVCTFPQCDAPCFRNVDEWFEHEKIVHQRPALIPANSCPCCFEWGCRLQKENLAKEKGQRDPPGPIKAKAEEFKEHLAVHLKRLALVAIPFRSDEEDENLLEKAKAGLRKLVSADSQF